MESAHDQLEKSVCANSQLPDHPVYPKLDSKDVNTPPVSAGVAPSLHTSINIGVSTHLEPNSCDTPPSSRSASMKGTIETMRNMVGRWSKKVGEMAKAAEHLSRIFWQHLKIGPSFTEAAMGRISHSTKVVAEGGYDKIFRQTFDILPEEELKYAFACYLSTSAGPVMGTLYISTAKVAFCSDNPLSYEVGSQTEWSYYKVAIPLRQLRAARSSGSQTNSAEKYIQIISTDNHELWFMGFVSYENALKNLEEAVKSMHDLHA